VTVPETPVFLELRTRKPDSLLCSLGKIPQGYFAELSGQSAKSLSGEEVCPERGIDAGSEAFSA
jgi:hypothetical protein